MCRARATLISLLLLLALPASAQQVPNDPNLIGHWTLDDGSGTVAKEVTGKGLDGMLFGTPTWDKNGVNGGCLLFDGVDDYVFIDGRWRIPSYTMSVWFRCDSPGQRDILSAYERGVQHGVLVEMQANGTIRFLHRFPLGTGGGTNVYSTATVNDGQWHHVAVTKAKTEIVLYLDGLKAGSAADSSVFNPTDYFSLAVGTLDNERALARMWLGAIDDICIYDRALTPAELKPLGFRGKANGPTPADGAIGINTQLLQWKAGTDALFHNIYVGTTPELGPANLVGNKLSMLMYWHIPGFDPGVTYYWRVDEIQADGTTFAGDVWKFTTEPLTAYVPKPADGLQGIFPAPTLTWTPGKATVQHQVFFSSNQADVENGTAAADKGKVGPAQFEPGVLRSSTTYYWRIDEIKGDGSVSQGQVWSFVTADGAPKKVVRQWWSGITTGSAVVNLTSSPDYPYQPTGSELLDTFEGPTNWADNYGTRMFGWLIPPATGDYTFWIASDDASELRLSTDANPANAKMIAGVNTYTGSREWTKEANQKSAPVTLQAGQKYYIEALHKEGTGGDNLAVSWQGGPITTQAVISGQYIDGYALPALQAFGVGPADGAVDTAQSLTLSWSAGEKAQKHDVYLGTDKAAVRAADPTSPLYKGQQAGTTFDTGELEWGKTYYWRIDEINAGEADSPWKGAVWSFATASYIPVDDMESYTDAEGNRIYEAWIDGWTNGTGSVVGNIQAPFAERTIIHGGQQAMPMDYNNTRTPFYSEAEREFAPLANWTGNDVNALSLWFRGNPVSFVETAPGAVTMSAAGTDIWDVADQFRFAFKRLTGDGGIVAKVDSITNTNVWAKGGVMIRESLDAGSKFAYVVMTPSSGVSFGWRPSPNGTCSSTTVGNIRLAQWVKLTRAGNVFTAQYSADGKTWTDIKGTDGKPVATTIAMTGNLYVGLAVTSHAAGVTTTARFSSVAATGGVSGQWQTADVGIAHPGNTPEPLYVAVEDSAGKSAVAVHPDPAAVTLTTWTQWNVPLSSFTGINLAKIKKLYIGVGDRKAPVAGGTGRIYLDDIRVTRP
ncbi:MAG: LamG domain-containing protein [Planctomycetes bacterium]|nr:LamG domain-containing protein [Planctomycetota bacterium]